MRWAVTRSTRWSSAASYPLYSTRCEPTRRCAGWHSSAQHGVRPRNSWSLDRLFQHHPLPWFTGLHLLLSRTLSLPHVRGTSSLCQSGSGGWGRRNQLDRPSTAASTSANHPPNGVSVQPCVRMPGATGGSLVGPPLAVLEAADHPASPQLISCPCARQRPQRDHCCRFRPRRWAVGAKRRVAAHPCHSAARGSKHR